MIKTSIPSVDKTDIKEVLINKLIPEIMNRFPRCFKEVIFKMVNSPSHITKKERDWSEEVRYSVLIIRINHQPSNSYELNVL